MPRLSRRQLLKTAAISTALSTVPAPLLAASREKLVVPPLIEVRRGRPIVLTMQEMNYPLDGSHNVTVWGFNGNYLGPTIKIKSGSFAKLNYHNNLPQSVALSIQGLQASGELFGGAARVLKKGESWAPIVPIEQPAASCWYRSATLANSAYQTYRGLAGMWLIEDEQSLKANLPNKYGVDDIPLILQDMEFNNDGLQLFKQNQPHFVGNRLLVNGIEAPFLDVARGWIRLRLLNASLARAYDLRLDNDQEMLLIAQDLGFLPKAKSIKSLVLSPGERAEILLNMNEIDNVSLISGSKRSLYEKIKNMLFSGDELANNTVLELRAKGQLSAFNKQPNLTFETDAPAMLQQAVAQTREFNIDVTNGLINQRRFDPRKVDVMARKGTIERWILNASLPVGFTIQGAKFVVESQGEHQLQAEELAWKDTVWVKNKTQILVKFDQASSGNYPFLFGVSNLMLEDMGCLGVLMVQ
ncbi:TPA: multicopper oxidase domain-containing protein [Haemophilus influenzae]|uniref:multicopper oxidase domain-containing protein n=1 Tax=Haemophilus influenzae TaxID=727 RepID=UPI0001545784|nr:multicopper oxidase domain-containing protein [Haemophilus influenzae]ABQ98994.1 UDP-2,3-diacylglucosamine hydrolase [Haemophilus influenzae PittEE]AJO89020.1 Cell division protein FtsP precursor [Haemophilus influenzae]AVI95906.1 multicopper oxidase family protein [Haemophilus influenzae]AVI97679.1 multicopper oxidase family protein [Haemophilus influenzae]AVJ06698.1 multicopper oxidase family protein [Haemophilus influenzae]